MTELENLLLQAQAEIRSLRRANEVLGAKVETMDKMHAMLMAKPQLLVQGMSEDIAWSIQEMLDKLKQEADAKAAS